MQCSIFAHSPSLVLSLIITETSEITSTTNAKQQTMLINVSPRSKPVRRLHQFGFLQWTQKGVIKNISFVINGILLCVYHYYDSVFGWSRADCTLSPQSINSNFKKRLYKSIGYTLLFLLHVIFGFSIQYIGGKWCKWFYLIYFLK